MPTRWVIGEGDDHQTMSLRLAYRRDADAWRHWLVSQCSIVLHHLWCYCYQFFHPPTTLLTGDGNKDKCKTSVSSVCARRRLLTERRIPQG
eukprot:SAG22_NODE_2092_length_3024_cov_1.888205_1_plen_91_part_00